MAGLGFGGFGLLAAMIMITGGADGLDRWIYTLVEDRRTGAGMAVAQLVTTFGSYGYVIVITVGFATLALLVSRSVVPTVVLLISAPFASAAVYVIKLAVGRTRPPSALLMGEAPADYSFPSGHTTSGTVVFVLGIMIISCYLMSNRLRRALRIAAMIMALLIGSSRVYLGYHWTTDVIGGWLLAMIIVACGLLVVRVLAPSTEPQFGGPEDQMIKPDTPHSTSETAALDLSSGAQARSR